MSHRSRRAYDHRIKEQIIRSGDPELFPDLEIPRSTAVSWIRRGVGEIVSLVQEDGGEPALRHRIAKLEGRVAMLTAVLRLVLTLLRVSGFSLELSRVPDDSCPAQFPDTTGARTAYSPPASRGPLSVSASAPASSGTQHCQTRHPSTMVETLCVARLRHDPMQPLGAHVSVAAAASVTGIGGWQSGAVVN
jgi:hypothetical protein